MCAPGGAIGLFHNVRSCVKIFELDAFTVRLMGGSKNLGPLDCLGAPAAPPGPRSSGRAGNFNKEKFAMRSDLVFGALSHVSNRYRLCQLASKATRKLHKPNTRLQDTTNDVLSRFQITNPGSAAPVGAPAVQPVERRRAA
jgi:hypothetical protein